MVNLNKWQSIFNIVSLFMPLVDYVVTKIEELFKGSLSGEEKKAMAVKALVTAGADPATVGGAIDTVVATKNIVGEFTHGADVVSVVGSKGAGEAGDVKTKIVQE